MRRRAAAVEKLEQSQALLKELTDAGELLELAAAENDEKRYMRSSMSAQSLASTPPAPGPTPTPSSA